MIKSSQTQSTSKKSLINKLLETYPVSRLEKLLKAKEPKARFSSNSKDTKSLQHNWIPNVGSSFDDTMVFVLSSILYNDDNFNRDYYQNCLNQVRSTYLSLIQHHGITGGTKKWKEQTQYVVLLAENRNPEPLP